MGGVRTQVCAVGFGLAAPALRNSQLVTCVRLIVDSEDTWEEEESLDMNLVASFDHAHRQMPSPQAPARKQSGLVTRGASRSAKGIPEVWRTPLNAATGQTYICYAAALPRVASALCERRLTSAVWCDACALSVQRCISSL